MSAQHTPGPWSINKWSQPDTSIAIGTVGTPLIARVVLRDVSINEQKANARLIAAAPDLLDALQYLADEFRSVVNSEFATHRNPDPAKDDPAYSKAMAAITKAIG